jgi:hypothetical protein
MEIGSRVSRTSGEWPRKASTKELMGLEEEDDPGARRSVPSPDLAGPSPTDDRSSVFTLVNQERRQLLLLRSVLVTTGSF